MAFIHPVLDRRRFVTNLLTHAGSPRALLHHEHPFRRSLGDAILAWAAPALYREVYRAGDDEGCDLAVALIRQSADPA